LKFSVLRECCTQETVERPSLVMIYGASGVGKTRLLSTLAALLRVRLGSAILQCSAHELVENLVENIKRGSCRSFRNDLMTYQALLIDNIGVLACRPHAAEELFSCFRMYLRQGNPVFVASDLAPAIISTWSEKIADIMKESRIFPIFKRHCREGLWKIGSCPPF
jgi:chromosomal replication initiation ATPase DnaA